MSKTRILFWNVVLALLVVCSVFADDADVLMQQGAQAYYAGDYAQAAEKLDAAVKAGATSASVRYSAACAHARLGHVDTAFERLEQALDAGWRDVEMLRTQEDLDSLHDDPRWKVVLDRCQTRWDQYLKSLKEPALRAELLKRTREDQRVRLEAKPGVFNPQTAAEMRKIDADNTTFMLATIDKYGWPGKSMVGSDGAQAAFLLVQHADANPAFQKRCLELLEQAVKQKEAPADHLAYLTDRVLVAEGKPQRYGTQFHTVDGKLVPEPIEDEAHVDARRKEVGLPPMAEYERLMRSMSQP